MGDRVWPLLVRDKIPEIHRRIAEKLIAEFSRKRGVDVSIDPQVYDPARLVRLDLSPHPGINGFSIPFRPDQLEKLTWDKIRWLQRNPRYIMSIAKKHPGTWGRAVDPGRYMRVLNFYLALETKDLDVKIVLPKPEAKKPVVSMAGWRRMADPELGEIEYDARLEGFGWVSILVKKKIPIHDGRMAFCWAVLPGAIGGPRTRSGKIDPLVTKEEAIEWLRISLEKYPGPEGKGIEEYKKKLEYNIDYEYNIPTFKSLVQGKAEDGKDLNPVFHHIKTPVLLALYRAGYVRLSKEQLEKLGKG